MGWFDALITLLLCYGAWRGFQVGLVRSVFDLLGWIAGFAIAFKLAEPTAQLLFGSIQNSDIALVLGFAAVALLCVIGFGIVARVLQTLLHALKLRLTDKVFGLAFGVFKNAFVILVLIGALHPLLNKFSFYQNSSLAQAAQPVVPAAVKSAHWLRQRGGEWYQESA